MAEQFFIHKSFEQFADNIFMSSGELSLTYADTWNLVKEAIPVVYNLPKSDNRFIGIVCEPTIHTVINILAVMLSGHIVVLVSDKEPEENISKMMHSIDCHTIFDKQSIPSNVAVNKNLSLDDDATVIFSSGSSGMPKAIVHTFANHYYSAKGSNENIKLSKDDRWLLSLPLSHVSGLSILFRSMLAGSTVVLKDNNYSLSEHIEQYNITHLSLVEPQFREIQSADINYYSLKSVLVGGSKISRSLITDAYEKKIPVRMTYGSTEMTSQVTTTEENCHLEKLYSSGKVLLGRELKISDDGEILVKGKTLCKKYLNADMPIDNDGWFQTSDLGKLDSDGYLFVIGRKDNMFISGGENIYPEEIESILQESNLFTTVIIIDKYDSKFGKVPVLFYESDNEYILETIQKYLQDKLPRFKFPKEIYKLPEKYNPIGIKADRLFLRKWLRENH